MSFAPPGIASRDEVDALSLSVTGQRPNQFAPVQPDRSGSLPNMETEMSNLDLRGVDPLRHQEVKRRIKVIKDYLAIARPTASQTAAHAGQLGIGIPQFYRLVRSWRLHESPSQLAGAGARGRPRKRKDGVPAESRSIVDATIADMGADARQKDIFRTILERCATAGVEQPSRGAVWTYVMDARSGAASLASGPARLLVGRCWAKLPTLGDKGATFPEMAVCVLLPQRRVIGLDVSCEGRASAARALALAFAALGEAGAQTDVIINAGDSAEARDVHFARLGRDPPVSARSTSQALSRALGRSIAKLGILHRRHTASVERLLKTPKNQAVDCAEAKRQIEVAVAEHNAGLSPSGKDEDCAQAGQERAVRSDTVRRATISVAGAKPSGSGSASVSTSLL